MESQPPQQILEEHLNNFLDEEPVRMLEDSTILEDVRSITPTPTGSLHNVSIGRVSTYIYRTEMSKADSSNKRIVFPTFASHWAIIVCELNSPNEYGHAYHLTFHDPARAELSPPTGTSREVKFTPMFLEAIPEGMKEVGTTRFSHADRMRIGKRMIKAFGSYHRLFWNCQHFARLYLSVITDGVGEFEEWTLSQASNLFLCAFIVTTPIAITNKTCRNQEG